MKKYISLFLVLSCSLWAKQDLDSMLENLSKNSYVLETYELKKETLVRKKDHAKRRDFQDGVLVTLDYQRNQKKEEESSYTKKATAQLGPFFVSAYHQNGTKSDSVGFGVEKNVKDLFYSKYDNQLKQTSLEEEAERLEYQRNLEEKSLALVKLYQNYQDASSELGWSQEEYKKLEKEEKKIALSYQLGNVKKVDWEAIKVSRENLGLEIKNLKEKLQSYKVQFAQEFRIPIENASLPEIPMLDLDIEQGIKSYKQASIEEKKQKIAIQEESLKYLKYNEKMPDMKVRYEYLVPTGTKKEESVIGLSVSKKLFSDQYNLKEEENLLAEMRLELKETERNIVSEQRTKKADYEAYRTNYQAAQNRYDLEKSKYEIRKMEYDLGKVDYISVMEVFDKYLEAKVAIIKARNALAAYMYEMKLRSK